MEDAAGVRRHPPQRADVGDRVVKGAPVVIRYADDLVALCHSEEEAWTVKERLAAWLRPRGLSFNADKTRIVHLSEGFDFLGFNIRRYPNGKLLTKPSKTAMIQMRARLGREVSRLNGANAQAVIGTLNPIIKGWANYYRTGVSHRSFAAIDNWLYQRLRRWALRRHQNKGLRWIKDRYWGRYRLTRNDYWVFGDRDTGQHLVKAAWTPIVRHTKVKGRASPDDPALADYWQRRRRRGHPAPPMPSTALGLA